tara:strand:+ start:504 stop:707 length:204 start_codon:yes stop_codon:yes gene_type:complete
MINLNNLTWCAAAFRVSLWKIAAGITMLLALMRKPFGPKAIVMVKVHVGVAYYFVLGAYYPFFIAHD